MIVTIKVYLCIVSIELILMMSLSFLGIDIVYKNQLDIVISIFYLMNF